MVSVKALSLLAIAGSAVAAPAGGYGGHVVYETEVAVKTVVVTVEAGAPAATPAAQPAYTPPPQQYTPIHHHHSHKPKPSSTVVKVETPTPAPYTPPPKPETPTPTPTPEPEPTPTPTPTPAPPAETGYMSIVNEYRAKLGLPDLTVDSQLEANAYKTCKDGNGQMVHQLNPPSMAQVLAPGNMDEFKHIFVGGWLCEKPNMAGLNGECSTQSEGWYYTSTGHADILTSKDYTHIGCASDGKITGCDLR